ncbi:hypothetical protein N307_03930, partial [Dryobates pubescens]
GSLGLDVAAAVDVKLLDRSPQKIPTGIYGPIKINGRPVGCLLIGRSSASMSGVMVMTGLIDADYKGQIQIMVYTLFPPLIISANRKIAQLIPLPQLTEGLQPFSREQRGDGGFGSSTAPLTCLTATMDRRPQAQVMLEYQQQSVQLTGLLDTGADVTVVS